MINDSIQKNEYVKHDHYAKRCGFKENELFEKKRRVINKDYDRSIKELSNETHKTAIIDKYNNYTQKRFEHWNTSRKELFYEGRLKRKFKSFSKAHSAIAYTGRKITKNLKKMCEREGKQGIVIHGNGTFRPGGTGYGSLPKKAIIREIGTQFPVLILSETYTSQKCPISFRDIKEIEKENKLKQQQSSNKRIRRCTTVNENQNDNETQEMDRDAVGSVNIAQKGVYKLLNDPIPFFEFT